MRDDDASERHSAKQLGLCPVCGGDTQRVYDLDPFVIADCTSCHHRFADGPLDDTHVQSVYGDDYFFGGKDGYDDYLADQQLLREAGQRYGALLGKHSALGTLLDVGAAAGFLQSGYEDQGWRTTGLEPNAKMSEHARANLGLRSIVGDLESAKGLPQFDAVCLVQVIGHFHDLPRALDRASELTRPGGLVLVEYWRHDSAVARLFGKRWHEYSPPSVLHYFTRRTLDALMVRRGLNCIDAGSPKKYISGHHARSLLSHKLSGSGMMRLFGWLPQLIPGKLRLRYPALDLEWRLYRRMEEND